jgi:hypothetical protein
VYKLSLGRSSGRRSSPAASDTHPWPARLARGRCAGKETEDRHQRDTLGKGDGGRAAGKEKSLALEKEWR